MVKKSKKSKSKRMPLRKKYKIIRKVKEHHKKKAKEEKKKAATGGKRRIVEKDPGIPNSWPFKEEELAALEARRQKVIEEKERVKEAKKAAKAARKQLGQAGEGDGANNTAMDATATACGSGSSSDVAQLMSDAGARSRKFELLRQQHGEEGEDGGGGRRKELGDGSRRAFFREVLKVVEAADVVIEVLDARDPIGCRCPELEKMVLKSSGKRLVLLLNKIDLVPKEVVEKWLLYLREELPTIAFKCSTQAQRSNLSSQQAHGKHSKMFGGFKRKQQSTGASQSMLGMAGGVGADAADDGLGSSSGSQCLGADTLIQLLKNYCRNKDIKTGVTVGVVGLPNVGKSSLINSLKRARVANVGSTPGVTRAMQEVHLDKLVKLMDCPGVVLSPQGPDGVAAAALRNAVRVEQLSDPIAPVRRIVELCSKDTLMSAYKIARFADVDEFVRTVAFARGRLRKGGIPDNSAAARLILNDWNAGRIPFYTLPPKRESSADSSHAEAAHLVSEWGKEFDADAVFADERSAVIAELQPLVQREALYAELPASDPTNIDASMDDDADDDKNDEPEEAVQMEADDDDGNDGDGATDERPSRASKGEQSMRQNEALYTAEGILNPHAARADRKRRKKAKKSGGLAPKPIADDGDYDFAVDYGASA